MEVELRKSDTKTVGIVETLAFSIPMSGKLMEILSDLYTDSRVAIVRELSSNMMDAVRTLPDAPAGIIKLPTIMDPEISFEDFGIGMSHETVTEVFAVYTASTKDQDNVNTGGWGLGGKSPFSYTTSWTLISRWEGEERQYLMFKDEEGMSTCSLIGVHETEQGNGVKITLPIQEDDMDTFMAAAKYYTPFLPHPIKVVPSINSQEDYREEIEFSHHTKDEQGYGWSIPLHASMPRTARGWKPDQGESRYYTGNRATIVLADVPYPLHEDSNAACLEGLHPDLDFLAKLPVLLYMPSGALNVVPSRDSIQNTPRSREQIKSAFTKILAEVERHVKETTDLCETASELWEHLHDNFIAKKTLGNKHKDRKFLTVGTYHHRDEDGPWQAERWIDPTHGLGTEKYAVTEIREAYAKCEDSHVSVHLPQSFFDNYKIIPFHRVTKYNSNWNWSPEKTEKREALNRGEVFTYKPNESEFFIDDIITASTERVKQSESRTRNNNTTEMVYLIKRNDREPIKKKSESDIIALIMSLAQARLNKTSELDEPEKELPEDKIVRGNVAVDDEHEHWANVRVIAEVHDSDYTQMGYGFFNPSSAERITRSTYNRQRDPEAGGWYLRASAFKIKDPSWYNQDQGALDMAMQVKNLLPSRNVPWDWHDHETGLVLFAKGFELELDPTTWFPALPYILNKIKEKAGHYNPSAERAKSLFQNGLLPMQDMLTDPLIKGIRLPPALRRLQRLAYLAIPGDDSDSAALYCYDFLKLKGKEPIDQEILEANRIKMHEYIQNLKDNSPDIFSEMASGSRALLASRIAALEPESILLAREIQRSSP